MFEVLVEQRIERCKKSGKVDEGVRGKKRTCSNQLKKKRQRLEEGSKEAEAV
jgi:hypothetical protein